MEIDQMKEHEYHIEQTGQLISCVLGVVALLWFAWILFVKQKKKTTLEPPLPPGPKPLPLVGNLLSLDPELHAHFATLSQKYGPIFRLWLGNKVGIVISSPAIALEVLKEHDTIFANRDVPAAGKEATYGGSDIVWTSYGPEWRMLRKVCAREMLSDSSLDTFYDLRRREVRETIKYYYDQKGTPVKIGEQTFLTSLNVITNMLWGGTVKGDERAKLGAEFRELVRGIFQLLGTPNISDFYPSLARFDFQGIRKKMKAFAKRLDKLFEKVIDQRLKMETNGDDGKKDFLQVMLMKLQDDQGDDAKVPLTMKHLKALFVDMVVAGTETTSTTIEFVMSEMLNKPEVLRKVQQELEAVVGKDKIVEESHIQQLPYLLAVTKETLRLHPPLPLLEPHCPSKTCIIGGYTIPKGSRVFINAWALHRDPSVWKNPTEFRPERFLEKEYDYNGNDYGYLPYGSGRRICAGAAMATRMFMFSLASLIHSFEWKLPQGENIDLSEKFGNVLKKRVPLVVIPTPRLSNPTLYD